MEMSKWGESNRCSTVLTMHSDYQAVARSRQQQGDMDTRHVADKLNRAVEHAAQAIEALQHQDGYWSFALEADCTIPAEYILMMHVTGEIDDALQHRLAAYLRSRQNDEGGWPLYASGKAEISCSVKAYYALKLAGDAPDAPHMARARKLILAMGGAARCNVFTRIELAKFEQIPWRGVPFMPVEIMLLPAWFPFHISKVSYWSRTVMVPLLILYSLRTRAANPGKVDIQELFTTPPEREKHYFPIRSRLNRLLLNLERAARLFEPLIPTSLRRRAVRRARDWMVARLDRGGLGAIFPAMVNAHEALIELGYAPDHPLRQQSAQALRDLLIDEADATYCQPCNSPIWDTAIACLALQETGSEAAVKASVRGLDWLVQQQLQEQPGDWRESRPDLPGGGWAFQFNNSFYPDMDDTGMVAWALIRADDLCFDEPLRRAMDWACGMQSKNGGFAAFDADNNHAWLNHIPFADHGALLDPPTSDVSGRLAVVLGYLVHGEEKYRPHLDACLNFLRSEQEENGAWFGRWGTNYIYGTWSVLTGLMRAGIRPEEPMIQRAVAWLKSVQQPDGGWGESNDSYEQPELAGRGQISTAFQTAWAMLALMAAGEAGSAAVRRGAQYLMARQQQNGLWRDDAFTAPGFPRVFYLKYHGYCKYFPLWALAQYRNLTRPAGLRDEASLAGGSDGCSSSLANIEP